jgi:hypothetical protein
MQDPRSLAEQEVGAGRCLVAMIGHVTTIAIEEPTCTPSK